MRKHLQLLFLILVSIFLITCKKSDENSIVKLIPVKVGNEYQYIDTEGKIIINPQFSEATIFRDGLALVNTTGENKKWGFIGEDGKFIINAKYKQATVFSEGLAWVVEENAAPSCIDTNGKEKFKLPNAEMVKIFSESLAGFMVKSENDENKWGFVDKEGKIKINAQFSDIDNFSEGFCAVENRDGKWGYVDNNGKIIINYQFDQAYSFRNKRAIVRLGEKCGLIDDTGKFVINPQFSYMIEDNDLYIIRQDDKFGWADKEGKIIINPQFESVWQFKNNKIAPVKSGKSFGYIDKEGKIIINPQFDNAFSLNGKLAMVENSGKFGFIDEKGMYVINPQFDGISEDYILFIEYNKNKYDRVESDFSNINAILSAINVDNLEGLSFNSNIGNVQENFKKSDDYFKTTDYEHLLKSLKISNNASIDFYIEANPWDVSDSTMSKTFNKKAIITGFSYKINLSGRELNKKSELITKIRNSLKGYTEESYGNENYQEYNNNKQRIIISSNSYYPEIEIRIYPKSDENNIDISEGGD